MNSSVGRVFALDNVARFLWAAVMLTLPVTSFRYFPFMGEATYVRPLSAYPLALLLIVLLIQFLAIVSVSPGLLPSRPFWRLSSPLWPPP